MLCDPEEETSAVAPSGLLEKSRMDKGSDHSDSELQAHASIVAHLIVAADPRSRQLSPFYLWGN